MKNKLTFALLIFSANTIAQVNNPISRILIITSDSMMTDACGACSSPWNWYENTYKTLIDNWNDVYQNSGMSYSVEIAGVIWDKTYSDVGDLQNLFNISNPSHADLGKYHGMLATFAADYLILNSHSTNSNAIAGWASTTVPSVGNPAIFWTNNPGAPVWVHEAGHTHGLQHCDGYRQTYDNSNNFTTTNAVSGFYTTMQYLAGESNCNASNTGQIGFFAEYANAFADPSRTIFFAGSNRALGVNPTHSNTVSDHNSADATIRSLFMTPDTIQLDSNYNVDFFEYGNFLAVEKVILRNGFSVHNGTLKISVGSQVLAKRGIAENEFYIDEEKDRLRYPESVKKFMASLNPSNGTLQLEFEGEINTPGHLYIFDSFGRQSFRKKGVITEKTNSSQIISIPNLPRGTHFIRLDINGQKLYRKLSW